MFLIGKGKMSGGVFNRLSGYHNRKSIRLFGYNYSRPGYYFVTMCIHDRGQWLFGDIVDNKTVLNKTGVIVREELLTTANQRSNVIIDEYIIMPNHIHVIFKLTECRGTACRAQSVNQCSTFDTASGYANPGTARRALTKTIEQFGKPTIGTIPTIVRSFKSAVSKRIHIYNPQFEWQRNYYDCMIRNEKSLFFIRRYIQRNPMKWVDDFNNHMDKEIRDLETDFSMMNR
jgi:REP element-mobilizing transposase RayT